MSEIFPSAYGWLFIGQLVILLVVYIILRSKTRLGLLTSLCLSVLVVTSLTLFLEAMGRSSALQGQDKFSRLDIAILSGVALLFMGFFLPWVYITNIPKPQRLPDIFAQGTVYQAGYHVGALGWTIALLFAVPVFLTPKS